MKIGCLSFRKISKYFEIFIGIQISHQTINNNKVGYFDHMMSN